MKGIRLFLYLVLLTLGMTFPGGGPVFAQTPAADSVTDTLYRIGPRDLIQIEVFELPELNVERRVSAQGNVRLPVIGDFSVGGLTEQQASGALERVLEASYVERASVSIQVTEVRSRSFTVIGAAYNCRS